MEKKKSDPGLLILASCRPEACASVLVDTLHPTPYTLHPDACASVLVKTLIARADARASVRAFERRQIIIIIIIIIITILLLILS
jgi:hypothetical protein